MAPSELPPLLARGSTELLQAWEVDNNEEADEEESFTEEDGLAGNGAFSSNALASWTKRLRMAGTGRRLVLPVLVGLAGLAALAALASVGAGAATGLRALSSGSAGAISFVSVDTRSAPLLARFNNFTDGTSVGTRTPLTNLGEGRQWQGFKTKLRLLAHFLHGRLAAGQGAELVAYVDGEDVLWGGCDLTTFQDSYWRIRAHSGASIVFNAALTCSEQDCNEVPAVSKWACESAGDKDLNGGFWETYAGGCRGTWNDQCIARRICSACSLPPTLKFLNAGFFVGPVSALVKMVDWALSNYDRVSAWGDQSALAMYWLDHQNEVTLDYLGELAISLSDMGEDLLKADSAKQVVWNEAFERKQCLIHGNGFRGKVLAARLMDGLRPGWLAKHLEEFLHISIPAKDRGPLLEQLLHAPLAIAIKSLR
mmetsp:Transcript_19351/g.41158  ORF Transcript_19351/g.41158 Transcript_19351/m.41158 type:complete len:425 (+) Transcript_19351:85-1359(+)